MLLGTFGDHLIIKVFYMIYDVFIHLSMSCEFKLFFFKLQMFSYEKYLFELCQK